ncbi:TPA: von Willebrand factor binding protein Vwb [Staphylococcus aureus]|uniref:von Willebrand factor binding protein Vwb n=18 Tax=Staphylococcus aureus TaxID=1280 RepID=UPI0002B9323D|nr:von Willebrand factor binding protein Vwb [Staphylococcus aureus]EIB2246774.1 von Willebrand factor binding protein Vwb [Staphylococcus aureus]EJX1692628.1 von Willebrand factor binding protein Vwb [Staphylococcus aureus]EJX3516361.1 von Willebrand factor binding protein Vwb [Staphylococcus aureus]MBG1066814.1 von Willebrand factor binding protein Vwb [Staphylococcus aureus]MBK3936200.1 von Willebrand factor binding protein Vwb [Staphylococcus aureus]
MKNKLLVLSLGALCVSQIWESNHASAVVSGEKNPYVSKALELKDKSNKSNSYENYRDSLESLISSLSFADYEKYEEPEYEKAVKKYQQKFMAEDDALKNFLNEEKKIKNADISRKSNDLLGLTHERYSYIFDTLKKNKQEFLKDIEEIQLKNSDLKDFNNTEQHNADVEINNLENKVLMVGYTFYNTNKDEVEELYSELDLIVGEVQDKSDKKRAVNQRMLNRKKEDLEFIIDKFFKKIQQERPESIPALTSEKNHNQTMALKLKADTEEAKTNTAKRSKRSLNTQNHKSASQEVTAKQKAEYERKAEERKARFLDRQKSKKEPVVSLEYDFEHKQRFNNANDKQLVVSAPSKKPTTPTTYTETTTQVPMLTVERQTQQQIVYKTPKPLAGLNGESHDFTTTHQSPTTSNHTHNHLIEFEETSALPGRKSGSLVGISQIDSSHLTEREKRVIKREHVREAQKLVDNYKDTHSYKDRLNAQQKVNTLSEGHQKRFNKQINKVYNGK